MTSLPTERPNRDETCMAVAKVFAQRSTCSRASVGVVIALEGRIVATGYNGAPAGMAHCDHTCSCGVEGWAYNPNEGMEHLPDCPARAGCRNAVHAEANAIAFAARFGARVEGGVLYSTMGPCLPCSQLIVNSGIVRVAMAQPYRDRAGLDLLIRAGIQVS